jgi:hypothetical protein
LEGFEIDCPPDSTILSEFELPYDISLMMVWINVETIHKGDIFNAFYEPDFQGLVKKNLSVNSTSMVTDPVFIQVINIGYNISVKEQKSDILENLGEVLSIDRINNVITFSIPTTKYYPNNSNIIIQVNGIKNLNLASYGRHPIGSGKIGGSFLSKNGKYNVKYENTSLDTSKKFYYELEYLY